eukprot:646159-Prorocentrum_minimum.AAC.1
MASTPPSASPNPRMASTLPSASPNPRMASTRRCRGTDTSTDTYILCAAPVDMALTWRQRDADVAPT